ncbi:glycoside hydrolase family 3 protein [bacterium]|nr:glycoside hydrolase family 3 protein [bacterium]
MNRREFVRHIAAAVPCALVLSGCGTEKSPETEKKKAGVLTSFGCTLDEKDRQWLEDTWKAMTLEEKACQILMSFVASPQQLEDAQALAGQGRVGGIWEIPFFEKNRTLDYIVSWRDDLRNRARFPLLMGCDAEFGTRGICTEDGTLTPPNMALCATGSPQNAAEIARIIARECRAMGFHIIGSPVVDVNINPDNVIINIRSFSDDPVRVADMAEAFVGAMQAEGAAATAKHFPGHGDTSVNSHLDLPVIDHPLERIERVELFPYKRLIPKGLLAIMSAHIIFPAIDPSRPATLSKPVLTGLLREKLGFRGIIVSDEMAMNAIEKNFPFPNSVYDAVNAGVDLIVTQHNKKTAEALAEGASSGKIMPDRIEASARRILELKAYLKAYTAPPSLDEARKIVGCAEHRETALAIARKAVVAPRSEGLPLKADNSTALVILTNSKSGAPELKSVFLESVPGGTVFDPPPDSADALPDGVRKAKSVIVALKIQPLSWDPLGGKMPASHKALLEKIRSLGKKPAYLVMASPYIARELQDARTLVFTFGVGDPCARAGFEALFGRLTPQGVPPVRIAGILEPPA